MPAPYISEIKYRGGAADDFVEVVVDENYDVSGLQVVIYHPNGTVRSTNSLGALDGQQYDSDIYVVNNGVHMNGAVALVENGTVISFVSFEAVVSPTVGPAAGMSSTQIGTTGNNQNQSLTSTDGTNFTAGPITENTIPCFASGTLITTPLGCVPVERIEAGDQVSLAQGGTCRVVWHGTATVRLSARNRRAFAPVMIPAGTFGRGKPERDLFVSPQHRILMRSGQCELFFGSESVLVPAIHLVGWEGVRQVIETEEITYHHLLFEQHEVILSEGLETESFLLSDVTLDAFRAGPKAELLRLFPQFDGQPSSNAAFPCLRRFEAALALAG